MVYSDPVFDESFEVGSSDNYPSHIQDTQRRLFDDQLSLLHTDPVIQNNYYTTAYVDPRSPPPQREDANQQ